MKQKAHTHASAGPFHRHASTIGVVGVVGVVGGICGLDEIEKVIWAGDVIFATKHFNHRIPLGRKNTGHSCVADGGHPNTKAFRHAFSAKLVTDFGCVCHEKDR
ncbi:hypothetical protein [Pseudophaeobacter sp. 1A09344]|uniref:hypothetical protein n=1 Tax=Pseudophaeobacter sp. 1A09344 TaxID=3098144 RepID=UPI0034D58C7E